MGRSGAQFPGHLQEVIGAQGEHLNEEEIDAVTIIFVLQLLSSFVTFTWIARCYNTKVVSSDRLRTKFHVDSTNNDEALEVAPGPLGLPVFCCHLFRYCALFSFQTQKLLSFSSDCRRKKCTFKRCFCAPVECLTELGRGIELAAQHFHHSRCCVIVSQ